MIVDDAEQGEGLMPAAGVVMLVAVVLIVLALVYYLVSTILVLRRIAAGLDEAIAGVGEIVEKSAPVNGIVADINGQLDAGVALLEGLLVKKAGLSDAMGLIDERLPGCRRRRAPRRAREHRGRAAADRRGLHQGHADAGAARARGADRRRQPGGRGACETSRAAASRRACCTRTCARSGPRTCRARR